MTNVSYKLWCDWHLGRVTRELSKGEAEEIMASDFAMHLLVPTSAVKKMAQKYGGLQELVSSMDKVEMFSDIFGVAPEVFYFKVKSMIENEIDEVNLYMPKNTKRKTSLLEKIKKIFKSQYR